MRFVVTDNKRVGDWGAVYIAKKIKEFNPNPEKKFVLGLPTGSTPLQMYKRLIQFNKEGIISFKNVITFNMDEYVGLPKTHPQSYHYYMFNNFFNHIDIDQENINILNGMTKNYKEECRKYEEKILKNVYKYRKGNLIGELKDKNILLIDEGCETGMTALICIKTLLDVKVKSISYATPVIATDVFTNLNDMVDEIYTINKIVDFIDVDSYYEKKIEATSERIMSILEESPYYLPLQKQQGDKNNAI